MRNSITYFLLFNFICLYENKIKSMMGVKPKLAGVFLPGSKLRIKKELIKDIKSEYGHLYKVTPNIDGQIPCNKYAFKTNQFFIYSFNTTRICKQTTFDQDDISRIVNSTNVKELGYDKLHFEYFGNYKENLKGDIDAKLLNLPTGSTITITAAANHNGIKAISDEVIVQDVLPYISNPYLNYIRYILHNPDNNYFFVKLETGIEVFSTDIEQLTNFSDENVLKWQKAQIKRFIDFYSEVYGAYSEQINNEFKTFMNSDSYSLKADLARYKELLLFNAISKSQPQKVKDLFDSGVDINCQLITEATPLHIAVYMGRVALIKLLLNLGANVNAADIEGNTPITLASTLGYEAEFDILRECKANIEHITYSNESSLSKAARSGQVHIVEKLVNANATIINNGVDPILIAIGSGNLNIAMFLLSYIQYGCMFDKTLNNEIY